MQEAQKPILRYSRQRRDAHSCLWITEESLPLMYHGVGQDLCRLCQFAGTPKEKRKDVCHIFRRTFIAWAERNGIPRDYTMVVVGHSTEAMNSH